MKTISKWIHAIFLAWLFASVAATAAPGDAIYKVGTNGFYYTSSARPNIAKHMESFKPGDFVEAFPSDNKETMFIGLFRGQGRGNNGEPVFYFDFIQEIKRSDLPNIEYNPIGKEGFGGGLSIRGQAPSKSSPGGGVLGQNDSNGPAGTGPTRGAPGQDGDGLGGRVGSAVVSGAIGAGINAILLPPSARRDLEAKADAFRQATRRAAEQAEGLRQDGAKFEADVAQQFDALADASEKLLNASAAPAALPRNLGEMGSGSPAPSRIADPIDKGVAEIRSRYDNMKFVTERDQRLGDIALAAADAAEASHLKGDDARAAEFIEYAGELLDFVVGLNPITSVVSDSYGLLTGYSFVTGKELSNVERMIAGVSLATTIATSGASPTIVNGAGKVGELLMRYSPHAAGPVLKEMEGFIRGAGKLGFRTGQGVRDFARLTRETLGNQIGAVGTVGDLVKSGQVRLGAWAARYEMRAIEAADKLNGKLLARFPKYSAPYKPGTKVFEFALKKDETFLRLHHAGNKQGSWVIRAEAIDKSLTPAELRLKYSLPVTPDFVTEITVKEGSLMRRSTVNSAFGGGEGAIQYEILGHPGRTDFATFGPTRSILEGLAP